MWHDFGFDGDKEYEFNAREDYIRELAAEHHDPCAGHEDDFDKDGNPVEVVSEDFEFEDIDF